MRSPRLEDAARLWRALAEIGKLERNSCYAYLLLCSHFAETCLLAEHGGALTGFVLGYRLPGDPETMFIWQVGVVPAERQTGLARALLHSLLEQPACRGIRFVTATIDLTEVAPRALFRSFARDRGVTCEEVECFGAELFSEEHPAESLLKIGPLRE